MSSRAACNLAARITRTFDLFQFVLIETKINDSREKYFFPHWKTEPSLPSYIENKSQFQYFAVDI